jgi:hypothetical protein
VSFLFEYGFRREPTDRRVLDELQDAVALVDGLDIVTARTLLLADHFEQAARAAARYRWRFV